MNSRFTCLYFVLFIGLVTLISLKSKALETEDLETRTRKNIEHDLRRKKAYQEDQDKKNKSLIEREKGLALYLEEQENWDLAQAKAASEYKKSKKKELDESSPEYAADLEEKARFKRKIEEDRINQIQIKNKITAEYKSQLVNLNEEDELQIYSNRPRYEIRKRAQNKWAQTGLGSSSRGSGGSSGSRGSGGFNSGNDIFDAPQIPNQNNNFPPVDNFDDFPPPPSFDPGQNNGFDPGFNDSLPPPPPAFDDGDDF